MSVQIELATSRDEPQLRALLKTMPLESWVRVRYEREPNYFAATAVEGQKVDVILARDQATRAVVGFGTRSEKRCYVPGGEAWIGHLGHLRLTPAFRRGTVLARGYRFLRGLETGARAKAYLTAITEDNRTALAVLPSRRAGLPVYQAVGAYKVYALNPNLRTRAAAPSALQLRTATSADIPAVLALFRRMAERRRFFPVYDAEALGTGSGLLRDFHLRDLWLAWDGPRLVGTLGFWNQEAYKQHYIDGYAGWLRYLRWAYNGWAASRGRPTLPAAGAQVRSTVLSLVTSEGDDPAVLAALFHSGLRQLQQRDAANGAHATGLILAGFHEADPLRQVFERLPHVAHRHHLYLAGFDAAALAALDSPLPVYLELGAL